MSTVKYCHKKYINKGLVGFPSCGCKELDAKTKHGYRKLLDTHPLYKAWRGMLNRCYGTNLPQSKWYKHKGVTVCDEWLDDPKAFIDWGLANGWEPGLHIDKDIKCDELGISPKIYSPETCQFISPKMNVGYATDRSNFGSHPNVKLSHEDVETVIQLYRGGIIIAEIARRFFVDWKSINRILLISGEKSGKYKGVYYEAKR